MQKESARKAAEVMLAYANGEKIECVFRTDEAQIWQRTHRPVFNWEDYDYRVASDPNKIVSLKGFLDEVVKHPAHGFLKSKESDYVVSVVCADDHGLMLSAFIGSSQYWDWEDVANRYDFVDGKPFTVSE